MSVKNKLLGFRSNKLYKKIFACIYYAFCIIMIFSSVSEVPIVKANIYDMFIHKLSNILIASSFLIPALFISNFSIKTKIPIIKKNKWWTDVIGFLIIFFIILCSSEIVNVFHTNSYLQRLDAANTTEIIYKEHNPDEIPKNEQSDLSKEELNENLENLTEENRKEENKKEENSVENSKEESSNKNEENNNSSNQDEPIKQETTKPETSVSTQNMKVHYIDVGQGDSIFIELPNSQSMLIDAGESWKATTVVNYISRLGYSKIDYLVGTHPHADHIGGLAQIINSFNIGIVYMPKAVSTSKTYENLLNTIANKGLSVTTARSGVNILNQDGLKIDIIAPNSDSYSNLNNYSAVIKLTYKNNKFLFMGDAETKSESEILTDVKADVIKIGHHGSDTSSGQSFVNKVNPKYVIVMVGSGNKYDHPYEEILNRWRNVGATVYRTDINGNIVVLSDGNNINITTSR